MRPRIYVSGPLTSENGSEQVNVDRATEVAKKLFAAGWAPLCPHWSWYADKAMGLDWEAWLELDLPWVSAADALFRMDGASLGAEREVNLANELRIPVFYEWDGIPAPALVGNTLEAKYGQPGMPLSSSSNILQEAERLVWNDRQNDYGHPRDDFSRSAQMMTAILGSPVRTDQVPLLMIAVKLSRLCERYKRDSVVDLAGYAATLERVMED